VVILPKRIEGVKPHPEPTHHTPAAIPPQVSEGVDGGCEGVNEPRGVKPAADGRCRVCGNPLAPALAAFGHTAHVTCVPDGEPL
jgi:hypothetical protein